MQYTIHYIWATVVFNFLQNFSNYVIGLVSSYLLLFYLLYAIHWLVCTSVYTLAWTYPADYHVVQRTERARAVHSGRLRPYSVHPSWERRSPALLLRRRPHPSGGDRSRSPAANGGVCRSYYGFDLVSWCGERRLPVKPNAWCDICP